MLEVGGAMVGLKGEGDSNCEELLCGQQPTRLRCFCVPKVQLQFAGAGAGTFPQAANIGRIGAQPLVPTLSSANRSGGSGHRPPVVLQSGGGICNTGKALKINAWIDESLASALNVTTDEGMRLREASTVFGISTSFIRDHLYGRTTSR